MDNNLNALMDAANQKLDAQKKQLEESSSEDLYADMRQEMEQDDEQNIDIQRQEYDYPQEEYNIQHNPPEDEEDEYVLPKKSRKEKLRELEEAKKKIDKSKSSFRRVSLEDED